MLLILHGDARILCFIADFNNARPAVHSVVSELPITGLHYDVRTESLYISFSECDIRRMTIDDLLHSQVLVANKIQQPENTSTALPNNDHLIEEIFSEQCSTEMAQQQPHKWTVMSGRSRAASILDRYWSSS